MKRLLLPPAVLLAALAAVVVGRSLTQAEGSEPRAAAVADLLPDDPARVERLSRAIRIATVSGVPTHGATPFADFRAFLEGAFPALHAALEREEVGEGALLYRWEGSEPALDPVLLLAHYDVVPVEAGTEGRWMHPPFSGAVAQGAVWGRGALDDKASLMAILEAIEAAVALGERPRRTVLVALGPDEETGGNEGAAKVAELLAARGVRPSIVLDEGTAIVQGAVPGVAAPVALVGLAEKGYATLALEVDAPGGHSSTPPKSTAVGILARAVERLEARPMPARLAGPVREMLETVAPRASLARRVAYQNLWLFSPLVRRSLEGSPETDAALRTTTAVTMFESGVQANVLPGRARATVNFRILPGETVDDVLAHVWRVVDDRRVRVRVLDDDAGDPSPVAPTDADAYRLLARTIEEVYPRVVVAPFLVLGATDAKHFAGLTPHVYRFAPIRRGGEGEGGSPHGTDERVGVADYHDMVRFYGRFLANATR